MAITQHAGVQSRRNPHRNKLSLNDEETGGSTDLVCLDFCSLETVSDIVVLTTARLWAVGMANGGWGHTYPGGAGIPMKFLAFDIVAL
jgi:hypothetical protein